jgi:hypothetical protein
MLRRFETLLMAHTFVETTVDFTLGDVLHTAISVAIYTKSYMREKPASNIWLIVCPVMRCSIGGMRGSSVAL